MSTLAAWLVAIGTFLGGVLALAVGQVVFEAVTDPVKERIFRRPDFARRRGRNRGLLACGFFCSALALLSMLLMVAAATSGDDSHRDDALMFALVTVVLVGAGVALVLTWWRVAGRPRHH